MFRLIRLLFALIVLGIFLAVAVSVPLGKHTLAGHLRAIAGSAEAHDLEDGVAEKARETTQTLRQNLGASGGSSAQVAPATQPATAPPATPVAAPPRRPSRKHRLR